MSTLTKWSLTATGIFLILTAGAGDAPGALLGVALVSYAWLGRK